MLLKIDPEPPLDPMIIEELLEKAKSGEISAIAYCVVYRDGTTGNGWTLLHNTSTMIGGLMRLVNKLCE